MTKLNSPAPVWTARVFLPFSGFYETNLAADIEDDISREIDDAETQGVALGYDDFDIDYQALYSDIARGIADYFPDWIKSGTELDIRCRFIELWRPREYNFETDRIYCDIPRVDIKNLLNWLNEHDPYYFSSFVYNYFMPRSGFIPFYSNRLVEWEAFETWNDVQLSVVLAAVNQYITGEYPEYCDTLEGQFYEHWRGNNSVSDYMQLRSM